MLKPFILLLLALSTLGTVNSEQCPNNPTQDVLLPHPICSKFYQCVHGQKVERDCGPGTHFNPALKVCDWPANAGCEGSTTTSTTSAIPETTIPEEAGPPERSTPKEETTPFIEAAPQEETTPPEEITPPEETTSAEEITPPVETTPHWPDYDNGQMVERDSWPDYDNGQMVERDSWPDYDNGQMVERDSWSDYENDQKVEKETASTETSTPSEETTTPMKTTMPKETVLTERSTTSEETTPPKKTTIPEETAPTETSTVGTVGNTEKCPMNENVRLPHPTCSKFYQCIQGQKLEKNCAPGTHFNSVLGVCDYPEHARCEDLTSTLNPAIPGTTILEDTAPIETSTPSEQTTSPMKNPMPEETASLTTSTMSTVDAENTEKCFMYECVRLPHQSCSKFYQCINGQKVEKNCPTGTHFNPALKECDYPENAGCEGSITTSTTPATETSTLREETTSPMKTTIQEETPPPATSVGTGNTEICPIYENVRLPHPTCSKFYEYNQGQMVEKNCAPGTHFNPVLEVCDFPEHAGCENSITTSTTSAIPETTNPEETAPTKTSTPSEETTSPMKTTIPEETAPTETSSRSSPGAVNSVDCSTCEFMLLPHSMCSKFYECIHGEMVEKNCAPGTHFNPTLEVCDYPDHAGCENTTTTSTTSVIPETTIPEETTSTEISTPWAETTSTMKTTIPEETAPPATSTVSTVGTGSTEMCPICENVRLPHPTCSKFYQHIQGQMVEKNCAPGTHFNPTLKVCDFPEHAGCENSTTTSTTSAIPETTNPEETAPTETSTPSEETTSPMNTIIPEETAHSESSPPLKETTPSTETTIPEETAHPETSSRSTQGAVNTMDCSTGEFVLLPHPMCSKFYECIHGQMVEKNCAPGTHFNPTLEVCDYPDHAGCENSTTTSTTSLIPETTILEETVPTEMSTLLEVNTSLTKTTIPEERASKEISAPWEETTLPMKTIIPEETAHSESFPPLTEITPFTETTIPEETVPTEMSTLLEVTKSLTKTTIPEERASKEISAPWEETTLPMKTIIPEETAHSESSPPLTEITPFTETTIPEETVPTETSSLTEVTTSLTETTIPEGTTPAEQRECDGFHKETSSSTDEDDYPDTKPIECLHGYSEEYFVPDPKHCNRFYLCSKGTPVPLICPKGLYFNTKSMVCEAAQNEDPKQDLNEKPSNKVPNEKLFDRHPNQNQNNNGLNQVKGRKKPKSYPKHDNDSQKTTGSNYYDALIEKYKKQLTKYFPIKSSHWKGLKTSHHKG